MRLSHLILVLALIAGRTATAQQARPSGVTVPRATAQVAAASAAIPVGLLVGIGIPAVLVKDDDHSVAGPIIGGIVGAAVGGTVAPALVVNAVGTGGAPHGSAADAIGGAAAGWLGAFTVVALYTASPLSKKNRVIDGVVWTVASALPAIGATLAYDRSRR